MNWLCRPCHRIRDAELRAELGVERLSPVPPVRRQRGYKGGVVAEAIKALGTKDPAVLLTHLKKNGIDVSQGTVYRVIRMMAA